MSKSTNQEGGKPGQVEIFCRYITRKGKKIYPKKGQFFHFWVDEKK